MFRPLENDYGPIVLPAATLNGAQISASCSCRMEKSSTGSQDSEQVFLLCFRRDERDEMTYVMLLCLRFQCIVIRRVSPINCDRPNPRRKQDGTISLFLTGELPRGGSFESRRRNAGRQEHNRGTRRRHGLKFVEAEEFAGRRSAIWCGKTPSSSEVLSGCSTATGRRSMASARWPV